jgi:hypothetical protein
MGVIPRPCLGCGRPTRRGSRCARCAGEEERSRTSRQPYRAAYNSREYARARARRRRIAEDRCEAILPDRSRCEHVGQEAHHLVPLASARNYAEAVALCTVENLRWVCWRHNPRGRRDSAGIEASA